MVPVDVIAPGEVLLTQVGVQFQVTLPTPGQFYRFRMRPLDTLQYSTVVQVYSWEDATYWRYREELAVFQTDNSIMIRQGFDTGASTERLALVPIGLGQRARLIELFVDGV